MVTVKKLLSLIPSSIRVTAKVAYELLWLKEFPKDPNQLGECRPTEKQIVINLNQTDIERLKCIIHECYHMLDLENEIGLTETQVLKLEEATYKFLKLNKIIK